jgi:hypothetical protein
MALRFLCWERSLKIHKSKGSYIQIFEGPKKGEGKKFIVHGYISAERTKLEVKVLFTQRLRAHAPWNSKTIKL